MNTLVRFLLIICVVLRTTSTNATDETKDVRDKFVAVSDASDSVKAKYADRESQPPQPLLDRSGTDESIKVENGRGIASSYEVDDDYAKQDHHAAFRKRAKPLKNIFMGIYKNYKSTYLGNKTSLEYKKTLKDRSNVPAPTWSETNNANGDEEEGVPLLANGEGEGQPIEMTKLNEEPQNGDVVVTTIITELSSSDNDGKNMEQENEKSTDVTSSPSSPTPLNKGNGTYLPKLSKKRLKRKHKYRINHKDYHSDNNKQIKILKRAKIPDPALGSDDPLLHSTNNSEFHYNVGPGVNMSLDMNNDIVNVNLNGDNLREIIHGRWLSDNTARGRGKKYEMVTKVLPLFILPFLIQSAIVPFLVTKLKLLLMKSILVGKLAIFLLIVSAIKNSNKMMQTYEVAPSYWAGEPSRRSELAAAASAAAYNGYRVEGKPTAWVN